MNLSKLTELERKLLDALHLLRWEVVAYTYRGSSVDPLLSQAHLRFADSVIELAERGYT